LLPEHSISSWALLELEQQVIFLCNLKAHKRGESYSVMVVQTAETQQAELVDQRAELQQ
jgi:hypothetical protein